MNMPTTTRRCGASRNDKMNKTKALRLIGLTGLGSLLTVLAAPSLAQESGNYFYGGGSLGQSRAKIDERRITDALQDSGLTTTGFSRDEKDLGYKLFGGYQFSRHFGVEAGYFSLGEFKFRSDTLPTGTLRGQSQIKGLNLDLVGTLPLTDSLSAIARVGAQHAWTQDEFSGTGAVIVTNRSPTAHSTSYKAGLGLQYEIASWLLVRGEAERYRVNDAVGNRGDVNLMSVSLVFPFGRRKTQAPQMAAAPAYVEPVPAPAPVAAPAPVVVAAPVVAPVARPPEPRRVSFSADSLFAFDKSDVKPEGRQALDQFSKELASTQYDLITVEGHTDRLGSSAYNEKLSTRRAESVKSYLVNSGGIDPKKISATGKGESTPVTQPTDCKGAKPTVQLIACLQADRRVEVEVTGTR
jgi:OOP family OmpA-OmpF porin